MNTITNAVLAITHNPAAKTVRVKVTCTVLFGETELNLMRAVAGRWFKLTCRLRGADILPDPDDNLYLIPQAFYFPDAPPVTPSEVRTFDVTLPQGTLNEDNGIDEIYASLELSPVLFATVTRKSNVIAHEYVHPLPLAVAE